MEDEDPLILNGILSQSPAQFASLWAIREGLTEAIGKEGKAYKYDFSLPLATFDDFLNTVRKRCDEQGLVRDGLVRGVVGFGHVGDGKNFLSFFSSSSVYFRQLTSEHNRFRIQPTC